MSVGSRSNNERRLHRIALLLHAALIRRRSPAPGSPVEPETPATIDPTAAEWRATGATWCEQHQQWEWGRNPDAGLGEAMYGASAWVLSNGRWAVWLDDCTDGFDSAREAWEFVVACQVAALGLTPSGDER